MFGLFREKSVTEVAVEDAVRRVLKEYSEATTEEIAALGTIRKLRNEKEKLTEQISDLKLENRQTEREINHKLGLAKLRQEAEAELADGRLDAREEQMDKMRDVAVGEAKIAAREEAMKKADELLGEQVKRMERMVDTLVKALPSAEMVIAIGGEKD